MPIYDFLFNFYWHFLSISYRFRDIRLKSFQGLTLTYDLLVVTRGQKYFRHSKAHVWLPIQRLWHFVSISYRFRDTYSTSKFLPFDLDLWPLGVAWGQKYVHHLKAHTRYPI